MGMFRTDLAFVIFLVLPAHWRCSTCSYTCNHFQQWLNYRISLAMYYIHIILLRFSGEVVLSSQKFKVPHAKTD
ncbi:hypothetical protein GGU10DRAFT_84385 [Lentinula aff. detonsa]|uniref:Secreted protein n=1 Tax=Lentinula aff. detonsa TaxID=2804958 RepID=A0AA38NBW9_9AGAR|nr:hypothetical protein GGU10DRAFT_84385 [Lentinula aff. detonsa]